MKKWVLIYVAMLLTPFAFGWGFFGHRKINASAVFLLPPGMLVLYKPNIAFLEEHAVDPDKRRYSIAAEGPRHYIDLDRFPDWSPDSLPRKWKDAVKKFPADSLQASGIVPWWLQTMLFRLTQAFRDKNQSKILKLSAEIGHYIADSHVPLHASSNHNGQLTGQRGIHGFWESRIPELLADKEWDFFIGKAQYIRDPVTYIWDRVLESGAAADTVLRIEKQLSQQVGPDQRYAFEDRNGALVRQYSSYYTQLYNAQLRGMVERRMRQAIFSVASFWFTAWVNAGKPDLTTLVGRDFTETDAREFSSLDSAWKAGNRRDHE